MTKQNYSPELTRAVRVAQGWTARGDIGGTVYYWFPPGTEAPPTLASKVDDLPPITEEDLRWLDRQVAHVDPIADLLDIVENEHGQLCSPQGEWHPAGPGPESWGQCIACADAVDTGDEGIAWLVLHEVLVQYHGWIRSTSPDLAYRWWLWDCPPHERGPWACLALIGAKGDDDATE